MLCLLGHFDHDFDAAIAVSAVQFVSVNDVGERKAMRDDSAYVNSAAGD
jgi:hypothetical protein